MGRTLSTPKVPVSALVAGSGSCSTSRVCAFCDRISFTERARRAHRGEAAGSEEDEEEDEEEEANEEEEDAIEEPTPAQRGPAAAEAGLSLRLPSLPNGPSPGSTGGWRTRWGSSD